MELLLKALKTTIIVDLNHQIGHQSIFQKIVYILTTLLIFPVNNKRNINRISPPHQNHLISHHLLQVFYLILKVRVAPLIQDEGIEGDIAVVQILIQTGDLNKNIGAPEIGKEQNAGQGLAHPAEIRIDADY